MIATLDDALNYANLVKIEGNDHVQIDLNLVSKPMIIHVKNQQHVLLEKEKEVLGFYLSDHPIVQIKQKINQPITSIALIKDQQTHTCCVMIDKIKSIKTKRGDSMAFVTLSDDTSSMDGILWPNLYNIVKDDLEKGLIVLVKGKFDPKQTFLITSLEKIEISEGK